MVADCRPTDHRIMALVVTEPLGERAASYRASIVSMPGSRRHHEAVKRLIERPGLESALIVDLTKSLGDKTAASMQRKKDGIDNWAQERVAKARLGWDAAVGRGGGFIETRSRRA